MVADSSAAAAALRSQVESGSEGQGRSAGVTEAGMGQASTVMGSISAANAPGPATNASEAESPKDGASSASMGSNQTMRGVAGVQEGTLLPGLGGTAVPAVIRMPRRGGTGADIASILKRANDSHVLRHSTVALLVSLGW